MAQPYPKKDTPANYPIDPLIAKRWSPVAFSNQPIPSEKIFSLFEAMRWAPSSDNRQPWRIIYATQDNQKDFERLASLLNEGNAYAKQAYLLMITCAFSRLEDKPGINVYAQHDAGLGTQNLLLQAVSMDLVVHQIGGFDKAKSRQLLGIPDDVQPMVMIAVGYPGDPKILTNEKWIEKQTRPRVRKPISEFAFEGAWK